MRVNILVAVCLACSCEARKDNRDDLGTLLFAMQPNMRANSGIGVRARATTGPGFEATKRRLAAAHMGDEPDTAVSTGAAAIGAALGVFLEQDLLAVGLLALAAAYATTLNNGVGDAAKSVGGTAVKAYDKGKELNEQYDLLPKAKGAADTAFTLADNLNKNYGITDKIDEKLLIGEKIQKARSKFDDVTSSVTSKVDELKESATKSE